MLLSNASVCGGPGDQLSSITSLIKICEQLTICGGVYHTSVKVYNCYFKKSKCKYVAIL